MRRFLPILTVFLPVTALYLFGGLEFFERKWMDTQFRMTDRNVEAGIVLVDIDPRSLEALEVWPWPRGYHATVIEQLLAAGAHRVGFDIDFSARSNPDDDREFTEELERSKGRVVLPVLEQWQYIWPDSVKLVSQEPLSDFARHASLGTINVQPGPDGLVRIYNNRGTRHRRLIPSFSSALADDPRPDLQSFYIDFGISPHSIPRVSYVDVITGQFDHSLVEGKAVIVGSTAVELGDQIAVPVSAALPGPLLQALAFETMNQDRVLERAGPEVALAISLALVLFVGPWFQVASWRRAGTVTVFTGAAILLATWGIQLQLNLLVDSMPIVFNLAGSYVFALFWRIDQQDLGLLTQGVAMRRTESLMRNVVERSFDAIVTVTADGIIETFNRSAQQLFGFSEQEALGRPLTQLVFSSDRVPEGGLLAQATDAPVEAVGRSRIGRTFPVELVVTAIDTEDDPKIVAVIRDITERKAHQMELQHQATHDPLTDLPNRFLLHDRVKHALEGTPDEGELIAILLLDLDRFKEINDVLGHHTGDILLQQVARRLEVPLQPTETIARLGGDEFAILLPSTTPEEAKRLGWKLIEVLRAPFHVERLNFQIDTSVGIVYSPDHGEDAETLLQRADVAMYVAKRKRSGLAIYSPEQDFNSIRHLLLRGDLRLAIEDDLLSLVYQPKISAESDRIIGVEALLRWEHPEHGFIPPDEFIGLAEHSGLIRPLTQWVIRTGLQQCAQWLKDGLDLKLSLNLSARNLLEEDLPESTERLLSELGVPPERLIFEITESVIMEDPERALKVVTELRDLGLGISIDDFGTGYSSLAYLMRLPAEELKIDRSFVMQMERDPGSATIVHSTIDLAHNLGLKVVAEGVESGATWNVLKELGCDLGQGYFFSRPVPVDGLLEWIDAHGAPEVVSGPQIEPAMMVPHLTD